MMGSVAGAANPGLTYLTQLLSSSGSPLLSAGVTSSQVQSALASASPSDVAELSEQAMQLQNVETLFGAIDGLETTTTPASLLDSIVGSLSSSTPSSTLSSELAAYTGQQQADENQSLLGSPSVNVLG